MSKDENILLDLGMTAVFLGLMGALVGLMVYSPTFFHVLAILGVVSLFVVAYFALAMVKAIQDDTISKMLLIILAISMFSAIAWMNNAGIPMSGVFVVIGGVMVIVGVIMRWFDGGERKRKRGRPRKKRI